MAIDYTCRMPAPATPMVDPKTGIMSSAMWHWMLSMFKRTGDADPGIGTVDAEALAAAAQAAATAASGAVLTEAGIRAAADATEATTRAAAITTEATTRASADTTLTTAITTEATTRASADTTLTTALATETTNRTTADALLAPKATPVFTTSIQIDTGGPTWTEGAAAPSSTQPVGSLYSRAGGAIGSTLYVSRGGGTWAAVAGV